MCQYVIHHHTIKGSITAKDTKQLLEIVTHFGKQKLWVYRVSDGTWWTQETDLFNNVMYAMTRERKVPAEYVLLQKIFK